MKFAASQVLRAVLLAAACAVSAAAGADANVTVQTLYSFSGSADGGKPTAGLVVGPDGNFYGTTSVGGTSNYGTIFQLTPSGTFTTLYAFSGTPTKAFSQPALVTGPDGNLYGLTTFGGVANAGLIYKISPTARFTALYSFSGGTDGGNPDAALFLASDGNFYGTTTAGVGTIFQVTPTGLLTTISHLGDIDGGAPYAPLIQGGDGLLYGTTFQGGGYSKTATSTPVYAGSVFSLSTAGTETELHAFQGLSDGGYPKSGLTLGKDGTLYGTTPLFGASGFGSAYKITPDGAYSAVNVPWMPTNSPFLAADGNFYVADTGPINNSATDFGSIYQMTSGLATSVIYSFPGGAGGAYPGGTLMQVADGTFYGTTYEGGASNAGTIFKMTVVSSSSSGGGSSSSSSSSGVSSSSSSSSSGSSSGGTGSGGGGAAGLPLLLGLALGALRRRWKPLSSRC